MIRASVPAAVVLACACSARVRPPDSPPGATEEEEEEDTGTAPVARVCTSLEAPPGLAAPTPSEDDPALLYRVVRLDSDAFDEEYAVMWFPRDASATPYGDGRPVVVSAIPALLTTDAPEAQVMPGVGFVEVQPLYPGWMSDGVQTTGPGDNGGDRSIRALADAVLFAAGRLATTDGFTIGQLAGTALCNDKVVVLGSSSGGETAAAALAQYWDSLSDVVLGLADHECPSMPQFTTMDSGAVWMDPDTDTDGDGDGFAWDDGRNLTYLPGACDETTCALDYGAMAWTEEWALSEVWPARFKTVRPDGLLYLDQDGDGRLDLTDAGSLDMDGDGVLGPDEDFVFIPHFDAHAEAGFDGHVYSAEATQAAADAGVLDPDAWPAHVATPAVAREFWDARNMMAWIPQIAAGAPPGFQATIEFTEIDHAVALPTRPHVLAVYEAFRSRGVAVRYNASEEAVDCLMEEDERAGWAGAVLPGASIAEEDLPDYALPDSLSNPMARTLAVAAVAWEVWGPFDRCPTDG